MRFSVVWYDCNDVLMMQCVYTDVLWSMSWLSLRCAEECSHLCKSLTALVPTAPSRRAQTAGPAAQVCLGFLAAAWLHGKREREGVYVRVSRGLWGEECSAILYVSSPSLALNGARTRGQRRSLRGPSMMDYTAESRLRALTAGSVLHVLP